MCWPRTLRPGPDGTGALQKCRSWRSPWSERESQPRAMHRGGGTRTQTGHARTVGTVQRAMSCPVPFRTAGRGRARERSRRDRGHRAPCRAVACCSRQSAPAVPHSSSPAAEPLDGRTEWGQASASWSLRRPRGQPRTFVHKCRPGVPPGSDISLEACGKRRREKRRK
jgi:hypothetical protein